jgi:hypothetical protein
MSVFHKYIIPTPEQRNQVRLEWGQKISHDAGRWQEAERKQSSDVCSIKEELLKTLHIADHHLSTMDFLDAAEAIHISSSSIQELIRRAPPLDEDDVWRKCANTKWSLYFKRQIAWMRQL